MTAGLLHHIVLSLVTCHLSRISVRGDEQLLRNTILAMFLCAAIITGAVAQEPTAPQTGVTAPQPATLEERLGADDGFALAILITANMRGNLEVCDCNYPRGGLARRLGYLEAFKKRFKD